MESNIKSLIPVFEKRLGILTEQEILIQNKHDDTGILNNVVVGLEQYFYGLSIIPNSNKLEYVLVFITSEKELEGYFLQLCPSLKSRNHLLMLYSTFLSQEFNIVARETFNTFQHATRTYLEKNGYFTYDEKDSKKFEGKNAEFLIKPSGDKFRGLAYTPFVKDFDEIEKPKNEKKPKSEKPNFVYLALNNRNGYYKIGRSINPKIREKTLQSEEPEVEFIEKWIAPEKIEIELHRKFKTKKTRGEWFNLSEVDLEILMTFMKVYESTEIQIN